MRVKVAKETYVILGMHVLTKVLNQIVPSLKGVTANKGRLKSNKHKQHFQRPNVKTIKFRFKIR